MTLGRFAESSRFNSATAVTPWMTADMSTDISSVRSLQFGHGGDAVDDGAAYAERVVIGKASIRPRR